MNNEYIIISKTVLEKRIEELEKQRNSEHKKGHDKSALRYENTILELKQILFQSTPLIPEIEKAFLAGENYEMSKTWHEDHGGENVQPDKQEYISNLKLDI